MEAEQKQKKILFAGLTILVLAGIFLYSASLLDRNTPVIQSVDTPAVAPAENDLVDEAVKYKQIRVSDGKVTFTFEVPENWITETRNMGEKSMTENELRDFLATNYRTDIKSSPDSTESDYASLSWNQIQEMSSREIEKYIVANSIPNASVSASDHIWYTDWNGYQTDFYIMSTANALKAIQGFKKWEEEDLKKYDKKRADMFRTVWSEATIDGRKTSIAQDQLEVLETGERVKEAIKGRPGGRTYYINLGQKTLRISKQATMGSKLDAQFDHLIETLKFE